MSKGQKIRQQRRPKAYVSSINTNTIHLKSPWVALWWSAAFPGFGHIIQCRFLHGFILIIWEFVINLKAQVNLGILYSFTGQFDKAISVLDQRWLLLYSAVYVYGLWDSYRTTVELNKFGILADRERSPFLPIKISNFAINFMDKTNPKIAAIWSLLMPGTGHLYVNRPATGFLILLWWIATSYYSNINQAIHLSFIGNFSEAIAITNPQWLLFMPSLYGFAIYDSYSMAVEHNKLFAIEQSRFLKDNYQDGNFPMPI